jgi:hypothetical protein
MNYFKILAMIGLVGVGVTLYAESEFEYDRNLKYVRNAELATLGKSGDPLAIQKKFDELNKQMITNATMSDDYWSLLMGIDGVCANDWSPELGDICIKGYQNFLRLEHLPSKEQMHHYREFEMALKSGVCCQTWNASQYHQIIKMIIDVIPVVESKKLPKLKGPKTMFGDVPLLGAPTPTEEEMKKMAEESKKANAIKWRNFQIHDFNLRYDHIIDQLKGDLMLAVTRSLDINPSDISTYVPILEKAGIPKDNINDLVKKYSNPPAQSVK